MMFGEQNSHPLEIDPYTENIRKGLLQVTLDTSHCTSTLFFVSAISHLPTDSRDCVDCYRDPDHPVCSARDLQAAGQKFPKTQKPKNFQISGEDIWIEKTLGSERAARPLLIAQQRETHDTVKELVHSFLEVQLKPLTHFSATDQAIRSNKLSLNLRNPFLMVALPGGEIVPFSADINFSAIKLPTPHKMV